MNERMHACRLTCTDEIATFAVSEVVEDPVPVVLCHLTVHEETRVAKLCYLPGQ